MILVLKKGKRLAATFWRLTQVLDFVPHQKYVYGKHNSKDELSRILMQLFKLPLTSAQELAVRNRTLDLLRPKEVDAKNIFTP